jgi:hypothetical protein
VERTAHSLRADDELVNAMLDDPRLFQRLMDDEQVLLHTSPWLFFSVLLRQARRDIEREAFTVEHRDQQKVLLFDTDQVVQLLANEPLREYLATMLASFTRVESVTVPVRVRPGIWRRYRTSTLDVEGLIRYTQSLDPESQFEPLRRIADVCLFLTGVFPEYIDAQFRYPHSRQIRPRVRGRVFRDRRDYESHGQAFYRLAAEHNTARVQDLHGVLATLSEHFVLAQKPLSFVANRYLQFTRHTLFDL